MSKNYSDAYVTNGGGTEGYGGDYDIRPAGYDDADPFGHEEGHQVRAGA